MMASPLPEGKGSRADVGVEVFLSVGFFTFPMFRGLDSFSTFSTLGFAAGIGLDEFDDHGEPGGFPFDFLTLGFFH